MEQKRVIKISEVLELLEKGLKREEIREELILTSGEMKKLFQHPKLKGRRAKVETSFIIEDDTFEKDPVMEEFESLENNSEQEVEEKDDSVIDI